MSATSGGTRDVEVTAAPKPRPRGELLVRLVQPLATPLILLLARLGVDPKAVVVAHALVGTVAAVLVAAGGGAAHLTAAVLLQVKTLLDNVDGGLARATGRVTRMGRYLDSVLDTAVNGLLFLALARYGPAAWGLPLALLAYLVQMLVLSLDFNLEQRYKRVRGQPVGDDEALPPGPPPRHLALVRRAYQLVLGPQDRLIERLDDALFTRLAGKRPEDADLEHRLAWSDLFSTASLVNLGLSTQLLALGVCLAAGAPFAYVYLVLAQAAFVLAVQVLRARRFVRYRRGA